ncbi:MAG: hypothetical protein ACOVQO_08235, partial [Limnohabitans sp.]
VAAEGGANGVTNKSLVHGRFLGQFFGYFLKSWACIKRLTTGRAVAADTQMYQVARVPGVSRTRE